MPLVWDEVNDDLDPRAFTIKTAIARMQAMGEDPVAPVMADDPDLTAVLQKLAQVMEQE